MLLDASRLNRAKFKDARTTAKGEPRAWVSLRRVETLWFMTGTQCNLSCANCYIESSPKNDALSFITVADVQPYLRELRARGEEDALVGFTGGEPFFNPHMIDILRLVLGEGFSTLVLTNAYALIKRVRAELQVLRRQHGDRLTLRISLDHHREALHDRERGRGTFMKTTEALRWLAADGFNLAIAGRQLADETSEESRAGYRRLLDSLGVTIDLEENLVIFPEMDPNRDVPEITVACWDILNKRPDEQMCATARMVVKRKGEARTKVLACTLIAYDAQFELGATLAEAEQDVFLNHPFCAQFCVLGGASCSS